MDYLDFLDTGDEEQDREDWLALIEGMQRQLLDIKLILLAVLVVLALPWFIYLVHFALHG